MDADSARETIGRVLFAYSGQAVATTTAEPTALFEGVELLHRVVESGVFLMDHVGMSHLEEFVGGNALEPLLLRYFLVT